MSAKSGIKTITHTGDEDLALEQISELRRIRR